MPNPFQAMAIARSVRPFSPWASIRRTADDDGWAIGDMWCLVIVFDDGTTQDLSY